MEPEKPPLPDEIKTDEVYSLRLSRHEWTVVLVALTGVNTRRRRDGSYNSDEQAHFAVCKAAIQDITDRLRSAAHAGATRADSTIAHAMTGAEVYAALVALREERERQIEDGNDRLADDVNGGSKALVRECGISREWAVRHS
jgi:hypothetical protein